MKILFVANKKTQFTHTSVYREKAMRELGYTPLFFESRQYMLPGRIRNRFSFLADWDFNRLNRKLIRVARNQRPGICIVIGDRLTLPLPETVMELKESGIKMVLWITDAPHLKSFSFIRQTVPFYDYVFCAGNESVELLERDGHAHVRWLPFACDPDYHRPVTLTDMEKREYSYDVVLVGGYYPNRWEIARRLGDYRVGIWGPNWHLSGTARHKNIDITDGRIDVEKWVKIYSAAQVVLVIHYQDGKIPCYQASPKIYEALACGCFVLTDRQKDVFALFNDQEHLVGFDDVNDLKQKLDYYFAHPEERRVIADAGRRRVLENHTYAQRIETILNKCIEE